MLISCLSSYDCRRLSGQWGRPWNTEPHQTDNFRLRFEGRTIDSELIGLGSFTNGISSMHRFRVQRKNFFPSVTGKYSLKLHGALRSLELGNQA